MTLSLSNAGNQVLRERDARRKASLSQEMAAKWRAGEIAFVFDEAPPDRPGRPDTPQLLPPNAMPKRGKAGSRGNRLALLHALAHIELNAIDLAWDAALRFGAVLPCGFASDWIEVGADEGRHFLLIDDRLRALGAHYGALPAHDGLWESAQRTAGNLRARLALVPMILEARGLDVSPETIGRLERAGDQESADILRTIYHDEIAHVGYGVKWFNWQCRESGDDPESAFHDCVRRYFRGGLKPPFNDWARNEAGFPLGFYAPTARTGQH